MRDCEASNSAVWPVNRKLMDLPDEVLIPLAASEGGDAAECVLVRYKNLIAMCVHRNSYVRPAIVEDAFQEGRIALIQAVRAWEPARGVKFITFATRFIMRAIWHLAISDYRKGAAIVQRPNGSVRLWNFSLEAMLVGEPRDDPERDRCPEELQCRGGALDTLPFRLDLERAMQRLTPDQAETLRLHALGYSDQELATLFGCSQNNISCRLKRARKRLAAYLKNEEENS